MLFLQTSFHIMTEPNEHGRSTILHSNELKTKLLSASPEMAAAEVRKLVMDLAYDTSEQLEAILKNILAQPAVIVDETPLT